MACTYNLFNLLGSGVTATGSWSGSGTSSPGYSAGGTPPTSNTFNTASIVAGSYTFIYSVTDGTCSDTATITINNYTTPVTVTWNSWVYIIPNDSSYLVPQASLNVAYCNTNTALTNLGTTDWIYGTSIAFTLGSSQSITSVTLHNQDLSPVTIVLANYLTGCAGTVVLGNLTFTGANSTTVCTAIQNCINNYLLCTGGEFYCTFGSEGNFTLSSKAKHVVNTSWIGIKKSTSYATRSDATNILAGGGFGRINGTGGTASGNYTATKCSVSLNSNWTKVYATNGPVQALVDTTTSDFNAIVPLSTSYNSFTTTTGTGPFTSSCCY